MLACNIDERGATARRIWGIICIVVGLIVAGAAVATGIWWLWLAVGGSMGAAAFAFFEARKKWCVMRALGVKTPL